MNNSEKVDDTPNSLILTDGYCSQYVRPTRGESMKPIEYRLATTPAGDLVLPRLRAVGIESILYEDRDMGSLAKYNFTDDHGHPLERCVDYIAILKALRGCRDMLREAAKQFRTTGDGGHAVLCDRHADCADHILNAGKMDDEKQ